jgi:lipoate-protein ligase B
LAYPQARALQESLAARIASGAAPPTLLLLEHPHTFTFGRRGKAANLLWDAATLRRRGVEVHWTDRGGDVTYHGPGQLVGYPLLPLGRVDLSGRLPQADYVGYLRRLELALIRALATLGLAAGQVPGATGVWVQPDVASRCPRCPPASRQRPSKIAAIGVRVDAAGISRHGFALNVSPDMSFWEGIVACDLPGHPAVSLADLLVPAPTVEQAAQALIPAFGREFGLQMVEAPQAEQLPA